MTIRFAVWPKSEIEARQHDIVALYREAFTPPPYNKPEVEIADFAQSLLSQLDREGYRFVAAIDHTSAQLAGFAYGYAIRAARWWCDAVRPALSAELAAAWLEDSYQFVELAVAPRFQGRGIGGRLHDHLLNGLEHDRVLLSTLQADTVAHHLYRRRGWVVLCQDFFFPGVPRRYQIMGLNLPRVPNPETMEALEQARTRQSLVSYNTLEDLFEDIG